MHEVIDKETRNTLRVTDAWLARNGHLVRPKTAKPASRKRTESATETTEVVETTSALPDINE